MRKYIMIVMALFAFAGVFAQKSKSTVQVPAAAKEAFAKGHPNATESWGTEGENYEGEFKEGGKTMSCVLTAHGKLMETETDMKMSELPASVTSYMVLHYKGVKITEASTIVKEDGSTVYEVEVKGKDLLFNTAGHLLK